MTTAKTAIVPYDPVTTLQKLEQAKLHLAECRTLDEVKKVRDIAEAAKVYAKAAHLSKEAQNYAAEVSLLATHRAGEILNQLDRNIGGDRKSNQAATVAGRSKYRETLDETATPERTARRWQRMSEIPESTVHAYIKEAKEKEEPITHGGLLMRVMQPETASESKDRQPVVALVERISSLKGSLNKIVELKHRFSKSELRQLVVACRDAKLEKFADKLEV